MAQTKIEWTATQKPDGTWAPGYTFNPWWGCVKVSEACSACYAEALAHRYGHDVWGPKSDRRFFGDKHWNQPLAWDKKAQREGVRHRVFCASMADVFEDHPDLPPHRYRLWDVIGQTLLLDWLILTKRPENIPQMVPGAWMRGAWPQNVWIGTTVETQRWADERIPHLLKVPAPVRFLSCEPLLGPVDLEPYLMRNFYAGEEKQPRAGSIGMKPYRVARLAPGIAWVIVGGESGPKARPMNPVWARSLRDQCYAAGVPYFFKQWGEFAECDPTDEEVGSNPEAFCRWADSDKPQKRVGKKAAGRLLDGRTWDEFPR